MNCENVRQQLSEGKPIDAAMAAHIGSCPGCRRMIETLETPAPAPDGSTLLAVEKLMLKDLKPVRPLPSDGWLMVLGILFFVVFVNAITMLVGYQGFHHLSQLQRILYYATISVFIVLFTRSLTEQLIPGENVRVGAALPVGGSLLLIGLLIVALFPQFDTAAFVQRGIPCLRLGLICAAVSSALAYPLVRRGFPASPLPAGLVGAGFAGLTGVAVLALHCPEQNAAHIIVWHLSVIAISALAGFLIASLTASRARLSRSS